MAGEEGEVADEDDGEALARARSAADGNAPDSLGEPGPEEDSVEPDLGFFRARGSLL